MTKEELGTLLRQLATARIERQRALSGMWSPSPRARERAT